MKVVLPRDKRGQAEGSIIDNVASALSKIDSIDSSTSWASIATDIVELILNDDRFRNYSSSRPRRWAT